MPYCGNCGALLGDTAARTGICRICGARVTPQGDVIETATSPRTAIGALTPKLAETHADPAATRASDPPNARERRPETWTLRGAPPASTPVVVAQERSRWLSASVMIAGIIIALGVIAAALLAQPWVPLGWNFLNISHAAADGAVTATATAENSATATAWAQYPPNPLSSPNPTGTSGRGAPTVTPGAQPTAPDPGSTATPAPTASQGAYLSVSAPTTACSLLNLAPRATFTVSNVGSPGSSLTWTAQVTSGKATLSPAAGTPVSQVPGGPSATVTVTFNSTLVHQTVVVTIFAPGAQNEPQSVTITC